MIGVGMRQGYGAVGDARKRLNSSPTQDDSGDASPVDPGVRDAVELAARIGRHAGETAVLAPARATGTIRLAAEPATIADLCTVDAVRATVDILRDGNIVLGDGDTDYAAADMLEVLAELHEQTVINLELLWQVRAFCNAVWDR